MTARLSPQPSWEDPKLVAACLAGDERAWRALVDKYKNLLFAILLKRGHDREQAADIFQTVWLDAYNDLPKLRQGGALKTWLISLAHHKSYHATRHKRRLESREQGTDEELDVADQGPDAGTFMIELERHQQVRQAVVGLPDRCRELIRMLFFRSPALPYRQVAERLGLATGSIGFIRGRCLKRLQRSLEQSGLG